MNLDYFDLFVMLLFLLVTLDIVLDRYSSRTKAIHKQRPVGYSPEPPTTRPTFPQLGQDE